MTPAEIGVAEARPRPSAARGAGALARFARPRLAAAGLAEVLAIGREMLAIPAAMALGLAERLGLGDPRRAGASCARSLVAALALAGARSTLAARELTPARAVAAVALAAARPAGDLPVRRLPRGARRACRPTPRSSRSPRRPRCRARRDRRLGPRSTCCSRRGRRRARDRRWRCSAAGAWPRLLFPLGAGGRRRRRRSSTSRGLDEGAAAIAVRGRRGAPARAPSGSQLAAAA